MRVLGSKICVGNSSQKRIGMKAIFNVAEIARYGNGGGTKVVLLPSTGNAPENNVQINPHRFLQPY
jgi:hypothetical protein